jgi:Zn-dependent M28 family amino/carboxypeptidase
MIKRLACFVLLASSLPHCFSQTIDKLISAKEVKRIEKTLSSDDMRGRRVFTPDIDKAADFIAAEFKDAKLQPVNGTSFLQEFVMYKPSFISTMGAVNGKPIDDRNVGALTTEQELFVSQATAGYKQVVVHAQDTFSLVLSRVQRAGGNYVLVIDTTHRALFDRIKRGRTLFSPKGNIVMILGNEEVKEFSIRYKQTVTESKLKNVVGILPGTTKKNEYVIFSGHYDHLGVGKPNEAGDSIYNGANDDAAGTTAVIVLANYFAKQKNNERTIIFAAFTGEESGGFGSQYFSQQFNPDEVVAMFNIEMIGTESKWGANSAYITGYEKSNMGKILEKNLEGTTFKFYPDPYPDQQLFYRSDNATLARYGVPAHTISTSKMDSEKFYHTQDDEIETLNMDNMAAIIKAIAISSTSIIAGKDTPTRVDMGQLK